MARGWSELADEAARALARSGNDLMSAPAVGFWVELGWPWWWGWAGAPCWLRNCTGHLFSLFAFNQLFHHCDDMDMAQ